MKNVGSLASALAHKNEKIKREAPGGVGVEEEHITHHDHLGVGSMEHVPIQELPVPSAVGSVGAAPEILPTYSISLSMSIPHGPW